MLVARRRWLLHFVAVTSVFAFAACSRVSTAPVGVPAPPDTMPPPITREMRGIWVATVANIDWPSRAGLSADQQRAELTDILDRAASAGFNTVVLQVRSAADALYPSPIEPWAKVLTGTQGTDPGYDPLAFAVAEAHARGLQLHAWINPFRAGSAWDSASFAPTHIFRTRRDLVRLYGGELWLDPGEPDVQDRVIRVVRDIVQRYDVDAIHADDFFYPYPINDSTGHPLDFPDSATYARSGSTLPRADWRRANVDHFIQRLYQEVHASKPMVEVGISPFGIWRPGNPPSVAGLDAYNAIYADSRTWLQQGWVDYLAPQLYWANGAPQQSFSVLLDWWKSQNSAGRHVWPGLAAYRVGDGSAGAFGASEIPDQIRITRESAGATGDVGALLYNTTSTLKRNGGAVAASIAPLYATRAIVPASPWLDAIPPPAPTIGVAGAVVQIVPATGEGARWWLVRSRHGGTWSTSLLFGDQRSATLPWAPERVMVNAIDEAGNASADVQWVRP
jgi:uncharacterized lipoprotein YddW (UPF0748 family)